MQSASIVPHANTSFFPLVAYREIYKREMSAFEILVLHDEDDLP